MTLLLPVGFFKSGPSYTPPGLGSSAASYTTNGGSDFASFTFTGILTPTTGDVLSLTGLAQEFTSSDTYTGTLGGTGLTLRTQSQGAADSGSGRASVGAIFTGRGVATGAARDLVVGATGSGSTQFSEASAHVANLTGWAGTVGTSVSNSVGDGSALSVSIAPTVAGSLLVAIAHEWAATHGASPLSEPANWTRLYRTSDTFFNAYDFGAVSFYRLAPSTSSLSVAPTWATGGKARSISVLELT